MLSAGSYVLISSPPPGPAGATAANCDGDAGGAIRTGSAWPGGTTGSGPDAGPVGRWSSERIGGRGGHDDLVAGPDPDAAELDVGGRGTPEDHDRGPPAQHLVDRCRQQGGVGAQHGRLSGVLQQGDEATGPPVAQVSVPATANSPDVSWNSASPTRPPPSSTCASRIDTTSS